MTPARNFGLDVARCAAILMVLASHLATASGGLSPVMAMAMDTMGQAGVELFFSLSGFLIGGILVRMARDGLTVSSIGRFMVRRWFRTLPLYYLMLIATGSWLHMGVWHSLLLVQNFFPAEARPMPVSWSLVMEEYFYVAFPLAMLGLHACGMRGVALVGATATGLIVACNSLRLWNGYGFGPSWPAPFVHENPLLRMDCAAYGALAGWLTSRPPAPHGVRHRWLLAAGLVTAGLSSGILVWVLGASIESLVKAGFLLWGQAFLALQTTAADGGFALVVVGLARSTLRWPRQIQAIVTWISLISYSMYLLHLPIIREFGRWTMAAPPMQMLAAATLTILAATITYHGIERPVLWLRDGVVPGKRPIV